MSVPVQRAGGLMLQMPCQPATPPRPCLSFPTNPAPIHAPCEDEGADWEHQGRAGGQRVRRGFVLSLPHSGRLVVAPVTLLSPDPPG